MIEINKNDECIEIKECLTFNGTVQRIYDEFLEIAKDNEESYEDKNELEKFLNHTLTHEDKIEILEYIADKYENEMNYFDNCSIYDEYLIKLCIEEWITDTFDIEIC